MSRTRWDFCHTVIPGNLKYDDETKARRMNNAHVDFELYTAYVYSDQLDYHINLWIDEMVQF